jgi:hypothetical protein
LYAVSVLTATAAASASAPPIVRVYVAGSAEAVSGSRDAIQDLCARSNVAVVVRDAAGADEALLAQSPAPGLAEAYVDLRPGTAPRVVVVDVETRKDLERRTLPEGASLEISIETMAHVVCAAVESSLATRTAALPAPQVRQERTTESAVPKPAQLGPAWTPQLSVFAAAANFGAGFRFGAGASFGLSQGRGPLRWGALVRVLGYPASDVEAAGGVASFGLIGVHLLPTVEWHASQAVTAFVGLGGGADWIRIEAGQPPPGAVGQAVGSSVDAIASAMLGVRLHLGSGVAALLAIDADADLSRHRYVTQSPQGSQTFFEPVRVRPAALAGLTVSLGGASVLDPRNEARK